MKRNSFWKISAVFRLEAMHFSHSATILKELRRAALNLLQSPEDPFEMRKL